MSKTQSLSLVDVFAGAGEEELKAIDATIAQIRGEIAKHEQTIAGLQTIRKALDVKINGKAERKKKDRTPSLVAKSIAAASRPSAVPPARGSAGNGAMLPGERIIAAIRERGPMSKAQLADELDMMSTSVAIAVSRSRGLMERGGLVHLNPNYDD